MIINKRNILFKKRPLKDSGFKCNKVPAPDFPVEKGNYLLGNEYSPVAVVIPRTKHDLIKIAIEGGAAIAGRLVTANIGIEKIIANIISNPNIRYVILFGFESDGHLAAQALLSLHKHGIDKTGKITDSDGLTPYIRNLPEAAVKRFRDQIIYTLNVTIQTSLKISQNIQFIIENSVPFFILLYLEKMAFHLMHPE